MARVTFVKSARQDNPVAKKGESYYHWTPFRSYKRYSKDRPRPSQLCSGRKSEVMATQEALSDALESVESVDDIRSACEMAAEEFRQQAEEYTDSADNMPENFQDGDQCNSMREMAESIEAAADELEGLDFDAPDPFADDEPEEPTMSQYGNGEDYEVAFDEWDSEHEQWEAQKSDSDDEIEQHFEQLKEDAQSASDNIDFMF